MRLSQDAILSLAIPSRISNKRVKAQSSGVWSHPLRQMSLQVGTPLMQRLQVLASTGSGHLGVCGAAACPSPNELRFAWM